MSLRGHSALRYSYDNTTHQTVMTPIALFNRKESHPVGTAVAKATVPTYTLTLTLFINNCACARGKTQTPHHVLLFISHVETEETTLHTMAHLNRNILDLKSIRIEESNSEDDQDFEGFNIVESIEHRDWVDNQVGRLHALASPHTEVSVMKSISEKNDFLGFDNYETKKHKFWTIDKVSEIRNIESEMKLKGLTQEDTDDSWYHYFSSDVTASPIAPSSPRDLCDSEFIFHTGDEDEAAGPSTPRKDKRSDILVPKPSLVPYGDSESEKEDKLEDNTEKKITYFVRDRKTASGKKVINCSEGHTYSISKPGTSKKSGQAPIYTYFRCIKRQSTPNKKDNNCGAKLRVENFPFDESENNMIVVPVGKEHNHEVSSSNSIKKEINEKLKIMIKEFPQMQTDDIIISVINSNVNFKEFYEHNYTPTLKNSMKKVVQRARPREAEENLNSDDSD